MEILNPISKLYHEPFHVTVPHKIKIDRMEIDLGKTRNKILGKKNKILEGDLDEGRFVKLKGYTGEFEIISNPGLKDGLYWLFIERSMHVSYDEHKITKLKEFYTSEIKTNSKSLEEMEFEEIQ